MSLKKQMGQLAHDTPKFKVSNPFEESLEIEKTDFF